MTVKLFTEAQVQQRIAEASSVWEADLASFDPTPWYGFDLDGTLAKYESGDWKKLGANYVGEPIWPMIDQVRKYLSEGKRVKIVTARCGLFRDNEAEMDAIHDWCELHIGQELEVTCIKDYAMVELWDDRVIQVLSNTGQRADIVAHAMAVQAMAVTGKVRSQADNPDYDATDFSHPAWWRGNDQGVWRVIDIVNKILDEGRDNGTYGCAKLEALANRLAGLRLDTQLLDFADTLPSGLMVLGDRDHPQGLAMTPKAPGFSHTRELLRQARQAREK